MRKHLNPYLVRLVVLASGERLPLLCRRSTGLPLFKPTLYSLTELRAQNRSSSTIQQALRAVMVLCLVLDRLNIELDQRLGEGRLLELGDLEELVRWCRLPLDAFVDEPERPEAASRVVSIERSRMRVPSAGPPEIHPNTVAIRIHYIRDYLEWRAGGHLLQLGRNRDGATLSSLKINSELLIAHFIRLAYNIYLILTNSIQPAFAGFLLFWNTFASF